MAMHHGNTLPHMVRDQFFQVIFYFSYLLQSCKKSFFSLAAIEVCFFPVLCSLSNANSELAQHCLVTQQGYNLSQRYDFLSN